MDRTQPETTATADRLIDRELTGKVIKCFYIVYDILGFGFLESVYRNAMELELKAHGLAVEREVPADVRFRDTKVGLFKIDLLVEGRLALELKASLTLSQADKSQLTNFLKSSTLDVGLLFHFGPEPAFYRFVHPRHLGLSGSVRDVR